MAGGSKLDGGGTTDDDPSDGYVSTKLEGHRYVLLEPIGAGQSATVYVALDKQLERRVAVKVLHEGRHAGSGLRLLREAQALARLRHPNVVTIHDVAQVGDRVFIVMELVEGMTLRRWLGERSPGWRQVLDVFMAAGRGLAAAHAQGLVHRDFKPDNVLVGHDGSVRVADFGLARLLDDPTLEISPVAETSPLACNVTRTGAIVGTPLYMAPEQHQAATADARADQFAFCVALFEALYGERPFPGDSIEELRDSAASGRLRTPSRRGLPARLLPIVARGLRPAPGDRHASMDALLALLGRARATSRRRLAIAAAAGVIGVATIALVAWPRGREDDLALIAPHAPAMPGQPRASVGILGFKNAGEEPEAEWMATAFGEMFGTELASGGALYPLVGEKVARVKHALAIDDEAPLPRATLARLRGLLGVDYVVMGSYREQDGVVRLEVRLQDTRTGAIVSMTEAGPIGNLPALVTAAGARVRAELHLPTVPPSNTSAARAAMPRGSATARLYAEAVALHDRGQRLQALPRLETVVAGEPEFAPGHDRLSSVLLFLGFYQRALAEAKRAVETAGSLPREQRLQIEANYHRSTMNLDEARTLYQTLFEFFPENRGYGLQLTLMQMQTGQLEEARKTLAAVRGLAGAADDPAVDGLEARMALEAGDYLQAVAASEVQLAKARALGFTDSVLEAHKSRATAHLGLRDLDRAMVAAGDHYRASSEAGDLSSAHRALRFISDLHLDRGDLRAARAAAEAGLAIGLTLTPSFAALSLLRLGWIARAQGDLATVERSTSAILSLRNDPEMQSYLPHDALIMRAGASLDDEDPGRAAKACAEAQSIPLGNHLRAQRRARAASWCQGLLAWSRGELADAERHLAQVPEIEYFDPTSFTRLVSRPEILARVLLDQGRPAAAADRARALRELHESLKRADEVAIDDVALAEALLALGNLPEAEAAVARAQARAVASAHVQLRFYQRRIGARIAAARGRAEDALGVLEADRAEALGQGLRETADEADLAAGMIEMSVAGRARAGAARLGALAARAQARGMSLLARKARAARAVAREE